jgi:hypothetical protein
MIGKLLAGAAVSVGLLSGTAGAAFGATSGTVPAGGCAHASKVLHRLEAVEARITVALPKLQAAEQKATQNGHPKLAARIGKRITRLQILQSKASARIPKIEQRCPGTGGNGTASVQPTSSLTL